MKRCFEMFKFRMMEVDQFEPFLEIFGIYYMMMVRRFLLFFQKVEHICEALAIILEKDDKHYNDDGNDES